MKDENKYRLRLKLRLPSRELGTTADRED